ncbi:hypothetical protein SLS62_002400 [Diatrype stigma]|uniref:Glutathione S-transferase n=1 Tax=Diatrype stigma TaxID=117547 RepID=A0AAN9UX60_9PEZI
MAPFGKIYSYPGHFRVHRAQVVAALNGLEVIEAPDFQMAVTNKTPEYLAKFPMGKVPALECADGFCLAEGGAICQYLAAAGPRAAQLLGPAGDIKTQARIAEWVFFAETELVSNLLPLIVMCLMKLLPYDEGRCNQHLASAERAFGKVEHALTTNATAGEKTRYLMGGPEITLADVMVTGALIPLFTSFIGAEMRAKIPNTVAYVQDLAATKEFLDAFGPLKMCETGVRG